MPYSAAIVLSRPQAAASTTGKRLASTIRISKFRTPCAVAIVKILRKAPTDRSGVTSSVTVDRIILFFLFSW